MRINWRERFVAAAIHFLITLAFAALAAALIFIVWFPGALAEMVGGTKLFLLIISVDVALGPLISLVIYSSSKARRHLIIDYSVVGLVQIAALVYGVLTLAGSRPVVIAFVQDRLEVVAATEIAETDLAAAVDPSYRTLSWTGPRLVAVEMPSDTREHNDLLTSALSGKDAQMMPKYFRPYDTARAAIDRRSQPLATLSASDAQKERIERAASRAGVPRDVLRWLLVHHRFGFAVALIDSRTGRPAEYVLMDPTEK